MSELRNRRNDQSWFQNNNPRKETEIPMQTLWKNIHGGNRMIQIIIWSIIALLALSLSTITFLNSEKEESG